MHRGNDRGLGPPLAKRKRGPIRPGRYPKTGMPRWRRPRRRNCRGAVVKSIDTTVHSWRWTAPLMQLGIERVAARKLPGDSDPLSLAIRAMMHTEGLIAFVQAESRTVTSIRAAECLVALRRWQFSHREMPSTLARVIGGSALTRVPADPFDGKPFRMTVIDEKPVIYSIGRDGKDDGGQKDSKFDTQAGDLIYQLPPLEDQTVIRPASLWGNRSSYVRGENVTHPMHVLSSEPLPEPCSCTSILG